MAKPPPKRQIKTVREALKFRWQLWVFGEPVDRSKELYYTRAWARAAGKKEHRID